MPLPRLRFAFVTLMLIVLLAGCSERTLETPVTLEGDIFGTFYQVTLADPITAERRDERRIGDPAGGQFIRLVRAEAAMRLAGDVGVVEGHRLNGGDVFAKPDIMRGGAFERFVFGLGEGVRRNGGGGEPCENRDHRSPARPDARGFHVTQHR